MNNEYVKIQAITAKNIKAVDEFTAILSGKSAHVSGKNGYGKSTIIRVLWDRLIGLEPSIVTKIGQEEGFYEMELTDGAKFRWEFNKFGGEKIIYTSSEGLKVKKDVLKAIISRYFKNQFDINKFLTTSEPRKRLEMISKLINIDLSEVQGRYVTAYKYRAEIKRDLKTLEAQIIPKPVFESGINLETYTKAEQENIRILRVNLASQKAIEVKERQRLNELYTKNLAANKGLEKEAEAEYQAELDKWQQSNDVAEKEIKDYNAIQKEKRERILSSQRDFGLIYNSLSETLFEFLFNYAGALCVINLNPEPETDRLFIPLIRPEKPELNLSDPMPEQIELNKTLGNKVVFENEIEKANIALQTKEDEISEITAKKAAHDILLENYVKYQKGIEEKAELVEVAEKEVETIFNEIKEVVSSAKLPPEFSIDLTHKNDILFNDFPITNETLASSAIYIAAFKLAIYNLDLFRVVHFDISYLDFENREKVRQAAKEMDIQLLSESAAVNQNDKTELNCIITDVSE